MYGLWQKPVRIAQVTVYGADESLADIAMRAMQGAYLGIIPRDSIFFFPASRIYNDVHVAHSDIAAVSLFRSGFTSLSMRVDYRVPIARWCGDSNIATSSADCYFFDASAFVYATTSSDVQPVNSFAVYEPLSDASRAGNPIGMTLPRADKFPTAFDFARQIASFGAPVTAVVFRDDEVDMHLASTTRITYVLGEEQNAFTALASARANLNLADGSVEYIDLRFPGKVYVKKKGISIPAVP